MTPDEIRKSVLKDGRFGDCMYRGSFGLYSDFLAEIAAALGEIRDELKRMNNREEIK